MMQASMSDDRPKFISTPVSVGDGLKHADGRTWAVLGAAAVVAILFVTLLALFTEKPNVRWPQSPQPQPRTAPAEAPAGDTGDEPKTYEVAPPGKVPAPAPIPG